MRRALLALIQFFHYTRIKAHTLNNVAHILVGYSVVVKFLYQISYQIVGKFWGMPSMWIVFLLVYVELGFEYRLRILGLH